MSSEVAPIPPPRRKKLPNLKASSSNPVESIRSSNNNKLVQLHIPGPSSSAPSSTVSKPTSVVGSSEGKKLKPVKPPRKIAPPGRRNSIGSDDGQGRGKWKSADHISKVNVGQPTSILEPRKATTVRILEGKKSSQLLTSSPNQSPVKINGQVSHQSVFQPPHPPKEQSKLPQSRSKPVRPSPFPSTIDKYVNSKNKKDIFHSDRPPAKIPPTQLAEVNGSSEYTYVNPKKLMYPNPLHNPEQEIKCMRQRKHSNSLSRKGENVLDNLPPFLALIKRTMYHQ